MYNEPAHLQGIEPYGKPRGFWVSVKGDDDWPHFCQDNNLFGNYLDVCHRIEIDYKKILIIDTPEKFMNFENNFYAVAKGFTCIHWRKVAAEYSGIIIAPYFNEFRFNSWYAGWDCASGCIWAAKDVVKNITEEKEI
jgi:hypothetical protein